MKKINMILMSFLFVTLGLFFVSALTVTEKQIITSSDGAAGDVFEHPMAVQGNTAVFAAKFNDQRNGAAYVFEKIDGEWVEQQKLVASDSEPFTFVSFGTGVALQANTIVIGGSGAKNANGDISGAAYVFEKIDGEWVETQKLTAANGVAGDDFAINVAISGDTLAIGAPGRFGGAFGSGVTYIYKRINGVWIESDLLIPSDPVLLGGFGFHLEYEGNTLVVGAPSADFFIPTQRAGSAYIFKNTESGWIEEAKLTAGVDKDLFGWDVDISGNTVVVGAMESEFSFLGSVGPGSAYVYTRSGNTWSEQAHLTASDGSGRDRFGISVAIEGDTVVVGAHGNDVARGAAYVFKRSGNDWSETRKLVASDAIQGTALGEAAAISGGEIFIGATNIDNSIFPFFVRPRVGPGSVYVFDVN